MEKITKTLGKVGYGALFVVLLPLLLVLWAKYTENNIHFPIPKIVGLDYTLIIVGFYLVIAGMWTLWSKGKGLPMNAFPPLHFVKEGVYDVFHHPIYVGAVLVSFGVSILCNSSSGFWLISPLFTLMIISYVIGFENEKIREHFGKKSHQTIFDLPARTLEKASFLEKMKLYVWIYLPWGILYELHILIGTPTDTIDTNVWIDNYIPVLNWTIISYSSVYLYALFIPFFLQTREDVNLFFRESVWAMILINICYICFPFVVEQKEIINQDFFGKWILWERGMDGENAALPSYHVCWAFITAQYYGRVFSKIKWLHYTIAVFISIACLTTGNHTILDVLGGFIIFFLVKNLDKTWLYIQKLSEKVANSWKEWHFGSIRIINHGFYAGLAGFVGFGLMANILGADTLFIIFIIGICGIVGAGLWAQLVEGSPILLRPYGYYGSVLGVPVGCILASFFSDKSAFYLIATTIVAAPWIQCIGRLRCLVQGCCHGKQTENGVGICFHHPKSRVNKLAGWSGKTLYPTQVYSIGANFVIGLLLLRLMSLEMHINFITGIYLILNGLSRFVEEYYRGEPQTPYFWGMRVYQWLAIASILIGCIFTCLYSSEKLLFSWNLSHLFASILFGVITMIAYGVDFPKSNKRFSRLSG